jgi:ribosomal protein S21
MKVKVDEGQGGFERAMRKFKKKITESGLLQEIRDRGEYVKPSIRRKLAKGKAKSRWQKYLRGQSMPKKMF